MEPAVGDLRRIVGADRVLTDNLVRFERDWTGHFSGAAPAVVLPGSVAEITEVLAYCHERSIAVVPQGGNTGLVGGGVPCEGEIIISLTRLDAVDLAARSLGKGAVRTGAGATLGQLQARLAPRDLRVPIDLGSRDSATVGGMASTNAGGSMAFRFGRMAHLVCGATVVTASGEVLDGDEAMWLAIGLEGTGCVIAALELRTSALPRSRTTMLAGFPGAREAVAAAGTLKELLPGLIAAEYLQAATAQLIRSALDHRLPVQPGDDDLVLFETEDTDESELDAALRAAAIENAVVAQDDAQASALWEMRDHLTEALHVAGPPLKLDVRVAPERVSDYLAWLSANGKPHVFGHLLEGNLHVNFLDVGPSERTATTRAVIAAAVEHGGRVAGEHGVGRVKRPLLDLERERPALERFESMKQRFDPNRILNPELQIPIYEIP